MNYFASTWEKFKFLVTPNELQQIIAEYHLVITNTCVPLDYIESPLIEYLSAYKYLYDTLMSGEEIVWKRDYPYFLSRGVTSDLSCCIYGDERVYRGKRNKIPVFDIPVAEFTPFSLFPSRDLDGKLCLSTSYYIGQTAGCYLGIEMIYPKKIQYESDNCAEILADQINTYNDFLRIRKSVKEITKPLTVIVSGVEKRTQIRVSEEVKRHLNESYLFRENNMVVK